MPERTVTLVQQQAAVLDAETAAGSILDSIDDDLSLVLRGTQQC